MHQPTNSLHKIQFMTVYWYAEILFLWSEGFPRDNTPGAETCRRLILVKNCILLRALVGLFINCKNTNAIKKHEIMSCLHMKTYSTLLTHCVKMCYNWWHLSLGCVLYFVFIKLFLFSAFDIFIANYTPKITGNLIHINVGEIINFSVSVFNYFTLPTCTPNFAEVAHPN
jgi:hypothetical protein